MPDERESPSGGWREVYDEMDAETRIEDATHRCPTCGHDCSNVVRNVYDCAEHGLFRVSGDAEDPARSENTEDENETNTENQTPRAD